VSGALEALTAAMREDGVGDATVPEWVGVDSASYERAVELALKEA